MTKHHPRAGLCSTHRHYLMDCASFDGLWKRARGRCEICDVPPERTPHGVLHIDHDPHVGYWGVRGLLCSRCNSSLLLNPILDPARVASYLADPWWQHILDAHEVPFEGIPEPAVGAIVMAGTNLKWQRTKRGWKRLSNLPHGTRGRIEPWSLIATSYGPHRVRIVSGQGALI